MLNAPRRIALKWSPGLCRATIFVHVLPSLACWPVEVPWWMAWCVVLLSGLSACVCWRKARRLHLACLLADEDGMLLDETAGAGRVQRGRLLPTSVRFGVLVVLHWAPEAGGRVRRFCVVRDGFSDEAWRGLNAWLRWGLREGGR